MNAMIRRSGPAIIGSAAGSDPIIEALDLELITGWNEKAESLLGWTGSDVWRKNVGDLLIAPVERAAYADWARRGREDALGCPLQEFTALHRDGRPFPALFKLLAKTSSEQGARYRLSLRALGEQVYTREEPFSAVESIRALLETLPVGVFIADGAGNIIQSNAEAQRIWDGARYVNIPQYGQYKGWWPSGEPIQAEDWAMARALNKGETSLNELVTIESLDGVRKTILNSASPIRNADQKIIGAVAVNQDITELKHVQDELQKSHEELEARVEERTVELSRTNEQMKAQIANRERAEEALYNEKEFLTAVLNNTEDGIVACDADGILTVFNRATREFHGLMESPIPPEQWAERYDLYMADGKTPLRKEDVPLYRALQGEKVHNFEMVIAPRDAPRRKILANGQAIFDSQGNKLGAIASMHNVTEQRAAEEELRRQQVLLQYIINFLPHSIFWKDREDRLLGGNKKFLTQALGVSSIEEMVGKTDYDYFPKEQADYFRKCDFAVMESGEPMLDIEEPQDQWEKGERILLTCKVPLRDETGAVIGLLGSFADITERKRMEEELEEAKRAAEAAAEAKSEFLTTMSHELRTPLTLILGPLETILSRYGGDISETVRDQLERIKRNAARLYVLVNDILDFTKAEAGKMQANWEQVDAGALVSEIVSDAEPAARSKNIQLRFGQDPELGQLPLDRGKFEKIVFNLLGNALKFTPVGGRIDVQLRSLGEDFELSVTDSGVGIAPEQQKLLFRKFQQLDSSATRKYEGTGIGLALVKEFTGLMGGSVGLESEPGKGSRFFVRFARTADRAMAAQLDQRQNLAPCNADGAGAVLLEHRLISKQAYPRSEQGAAPAGPRASTSGPRVLVVDDNPDMRAYVGEILAEEYRVETAENGAQALSAASAWPPDVIISDIMMPEMDGLELVSRLKGARELRGIPVILLTAKAGAEGVVMGLGVGADDYLGKPFAPAELKARVHAAHRLHRAQLDLEAALGAVRDTQEQLIHAGKMAAVGTLIAGLSHELNNPLAAILMSVQALMRASSRDETLMKGVLGTIEKQTRRCAHLVRTLLDFSRKQPSHRDAISPAALFDRVEELSEPMARRRGVRLCVERCELGRPGTALVVCVQEIETTLLNLLSNAIAATPADGQVWIRAKEHSQLERDGVQISITDTGEGIPDDVLPRIFDPFFTTKPPGEGTGLGLSLSRRIVDSHGGTIHIESKNGEGTSAIVWLPIEDTR